MTPLAPADASPWAGRVDLGVERGEDGRAAYTSLHSSGALAVRATVEGAWLVGASAHPVGGDRMGVGLRVGRGASLTVRSASATLARASIPARASSMEVDAVVEDGGSLTWCPSPGIAARGSLHHTSAQIELGPTARLEWVDAIVLGRHAEPPGSWSSRLRVLVAGRPLVVSELALGPAFPAWTSPAVLAAARCALSVLVVDPARAVPAVGRTSGRHGYAVPLGEHAWQIVTWGATVSECHRTFGSLATEPSRGWISTVLRQQLRAG
ncbi:MAG TPA: urease accessory protein UreD [Acidimicrobiales bacterium]|jgi:urease accessory protein